MTNTRQSRRVAKLTRPAWVPPKLVNPISAYDLCSQDLREASRDLCVAILLTFGHSGQQPDRMPRGAVHELQGACAPIIERMREAFAAGRGELFVAQHRSRA